jgi:hypothetical protein
MKQATDVHFVAQTSRVLAVLKASPGVGIGQTSEEFLVLFPYTEGQAGGSLELTAEGVRRWAEAYPAMADFVALPVAVPAPVVHAPEDVPVDDADHVVHDWPVADADPVVDALPVADADPVVDAAPEAEPVVDAVPDAGPAAMPDALPVAAVSRRASKRTRSNRQVVNVSALGGSNRH